MKTSRNLLRKLVGLPAKKRALREESRKPRIAKIKKRKSTVKKSKNMILFEQGFRSAQAITNMWNSQSSPQKVHVFGRRIHHGEVGIGIALYGLANKDYWLIGFGLGLTFDDIQDAHEWFTFKKRETP